MLSSPSNSGVVFPSGHSRLFLGFIAAKYRRDLFGDISFNLPDHTTDNKAQETNQNLMIIPKAEEI
jgi:hypothetical protein